MTVDDAIKLIVDVPENPDGPWFQLRLGRDPGFDRIKELRLALRVAWHATKSSKSLPHPIIFAAACILHFYDEARRNLKQSTSPLRPELLLYELPDLEMGAFDLLSGQTADGWTVVRTDLGE